jgi:hypothetical protein
MAKFVSIIYMKVNHYNRNIVGQPLYSLHTLLTTYTAVTDFIFNSALQTNRSVAAGSRTRTGHRGNVLRFLAEVKYFFHYLKRQSALGPPSVLCDVFRGQNGWGVKLTTHMHLVNSKNQWNYTATPPYAFIARQREFYFTSTQVLNATGMRGKFVVQML